MSLKKTLGKKPYVLFAIALLTALPLISVSPQLAAFDHNSQDNNVIPHFDHVFYIMMENNGVDQIVGNPNLPYINQLITTYGYDPNYYGVTHDSLANYVAAISGNNWDTHSDNPTQTFNHTNLVDQLVANHITWKGYMESLPYSGYTGAFYPSSSDNLYVLKHDPFLLFKDIVGNPQQRNNVVPLTQLTTDLSQNNVPQFVWISPNICNDMHGGPTECPYPNSNSISDPNAVQLFKDGDNFIQAWVKAITSSKAWTGNSVIFITWDEAEYPTSTSSIAQQTAFVAPGPDSPIAPVSVFSANGVTAPALPLTSSYGGYTGAVFGGGNVPLIVITTQMTGQGHGHGLSLTGPITVKTWADHYSILRTIEQGWNLGYIGMASDSTQVQSLSGFFQHQGHDNAGFSSILQAIETEFAHLRSIQK